MTHKCNYRCKDIPWEFDSRKLDTHYAWMRKELYAKGLSIAGLADQAGMDRAYVSKYLNGYHVNVTIGTIERLDDALSDLVRKER